jgi:hypothetical protein
MFSVSPGIGRLRRTLVQLLELSPVLQAHSIGVLQPVVQRLDELFIASSQELAMLLAALSAFCATVSGSVSVCLRYDSIGMYAQLGNAAPCGLNAIFGNDHSTHIPCLRRSGGVRQGFQPRGGGMCVATDATTSSKPRMGGIYPTS